MRAAVTQGEGAPRLTVDALGTACPIPVIRLAEAVERSVPGTLIEVLSDDAGAKVDIPVWCRMKEQEFVGREERDRGWVFLVRTR